MTGPYDILRCSRLRHFVPYTYGLVFWVVCTTKYCVKSLPRTSKLNFSKKRQFWKIGRVWECLGRSHGSNPTDVAVGAPSRDGWMTCTPRDHMEIPPEVYAKAYAKKVLKLVNLLILRRGGPLGISSTQSEL